MRGLLTAIATAGLCLALASPAFASNRVPTGVKRISISLTFPVQVSGGHKAVHKTITKAATVRKIVAAADALQAAQPQGVCPMMIRLGPELTVVFRNASGQMLAETKVEVSLGSRSTSGTSFCFPITFSGAGPSRRLLGNSYVRMLGRTIGTAIS